MPQIQYSEKYYDDVYEYRYARIRPRRFPARLDALFDLLHATNGVRARSRGFPRLEGTRDGHDGDAPRDIGVARGARCARYARSSACVSIGTRRDVFAGAFPARASLGIAERARRVPLRNRVAAHLASPSTAIDRHVVLPPDIAKLLPKGRLLSEVRFRTAIRLDAGATPERRRYRSSVSRPHRCRSGPVPLARSAGVSRDSSSPRARVARSARLTRASPFPSLSHRRSGAVSACSSPAAGCTTPSTGPSPTSCSTGACAVPAPTLQLDSRVSRACFSNRSGRRASAAAFPPRPPIASAPR